MALPAGPASSHVTLSAAGTIEVPEAFRAALKLAPRQEFVMELSEDALILKPRRSTLDEVFGCLHEYAIAYASSEERDAAERALIEEAVAENNPLPRRPLTGKR